MVAKKAIQQRQPLAAQVNTGSETMRRSTSRQLGFTLIEVTLALLVLGGSLIVLLGLQSSIIERTLRDNRKQRAMLFSRRILSSIEVARDPLPPQKTEGSFRDVLSSVDTSSSPAEQPDPEEADFKVRLEVESIGIPQMAENAMRKITLTLSWGANSADQLTSVYFTPGD